MSNSRIDVTKFMAAAGRLQRPNYYEVVITPPAGLKIDATTASRIAVLCSRVVYPGTTVDTFHYSSGTVSGLTTPSGETRHEVILEFYSPVDGAPASMFQAWKDLIIAQSTHTLGYLVDYAGTAEIWMLDKNGNRTTGKLLYEVWPKEIASVELSYGAANEIVRTTVTIDYSEYENLRSYDR